MIRLSRKAQQFILFVLFFTLIVVIVGIIMNEIVMPLYTKHNEERFLPGITERTLEEAFYILQSEGFTPQVKEKKYTSSHPPGIVLEQYPPGNSYVKEGRKVYLTVSEEERFVVMPNLVGKTIRGSELELKNLGVQIDTLEYEYSEMPRNVITWQSIPSGNSIRKGSKVTLIASRGKSREAFIVPQLFGLDLKKAEDTIISSGLQVGSIRYVQNPDLLDFTVLEQSIPAGEKVYAPLEIDLVVSVVDITNASKRFINR